MPTRKSSRTRAVSRRTQTKKTTEKGRARGGTTETTSKCTPFSVKVAILTPDDTHEIQFGLTKGCNPDNTAFWLIDFLLKEFKNGIPKTRVEVHVTIGADRHGHASTLARTKRLSPESVDLLNGPVADRASRLPAGTTSDKKLAGMLLSTL